MQLIKITLLALISLSSATPAPVKRTAAQIESTLTNIISDLTIFDSRVNSFNNGFLQVFFLELAAENVVTDFNTLNTQVVSTGTLTTAESSTIAGQVDTLTALLITILTDVITKVCWSIRRKGPQNNKLIKDYRSPLLKGLVRRLMSMMHSRILEQVTKNTSPTC